MTEPAWQTVHADFERNHNGWPLVIPPGGGKPVAYRRMTKYVDVLEDAYMLDRWRERQVAVGLAQRDDLRLSVLAHLSDRRMVDQAVRDAKEYAQSSAKATTGTAFHSLTDIVDRGGDLPAGLPGNVLKTLDRWREVTACLEVIAIEPKTVLDTHQAAGTPDRIYGYLGERYIGDTKSGNIKLGTLKIAMQLAGYSRSWLYDVGTGERTAHGCNVNRGIVMDVDLEQCTVELRWLDLETGWWALHDAARQVWQARRLDKYEALTKAFVVGEPPSRPSLRLELREDTRAAEVAAAEHERIAQIIADCSTADEVRGVWESFHDSWTDALTDLGFARLAQLKAQAQNTEGIPA